jgi:hypothetical protein
MGYNRSGQRHKERLRQRRKEERRVAAKAAAAQAEGNKGPSDQVKNVAHSATGKAADPAHAVVDKVTDKGR